jgi:hypothetical protein
MNSYMPGYLYNERESWFRTLNYTGEKKISIDSNLTHQAGKKI